MKYFNWKSNAFSVRTVVLSQLPQDQLQGGHSRAVIATTEIMALPVFFHLLTPPAHRGTQALHSLGFSVLAACLAAALPLQIPACSGKVWNNFRYIQVFWHGANLVSFIMSVQSGCSHNPADWTGPR